MICSMNALGSVLLQTVGTQWVKPKKCLEIRSFGTPLQLHTQEAARL